MGHCQETRGLARPLTKGGQVQPEAFAYAALGILNRAVYLVGGQVYKACRDFSQQGFEPQAGFQGLLRLLACEHMGEYLRNQLESIHNPIRPQRLLSQVAEGQHAYDFASDRQRQYNC